MNDSLKITYTQIHDAALIWIHSLPSGRVFSNQELYGRVEQMFPNAWRNRGDAAREPKYRNDARWAVQHAKRDGLVKDTNKRGQHRKL